MIIEKKSILKLSLCLGLLMSLTLPAWSTEDVLKRTLKPNGLGISLITPQEPGQYFSYTQEDAPKKIIVGDPNSKSATGLQILGFSVLSNAPLKSDSETPSNNTEPSFDLNTPEEEETVVEIIGEPLNYPNPFHYNNGTTIGYMLSKPANITLKIFDPFGHLILEETFNANTQGGLANEYNQLTINKQTFNYQDLSAGIYYYVLLNDSRVLGKGKMAVLP